MKKSFPLQSERHQPARVVEQIKSEIRKYLKREQSKKVPEGFDYFGFQCKIGASVEAASDCHERELGKGLDAGSAEGWQQAYVEIVSIPKKREGSKKD